MNETEKAVTLANDSDPEVYTFPTLRDTMAMAAVSGILANKNMEPDEPYYVANAAYNIADAMLERRKR